MKLNQIKKLLCRLAMFAAYILVMILFLSMLSPNTGHATFISRDWKTQDDNLLTYDDISGLEWLDISVTALLGYGGTLAEMAGDDLEGFRFASPEEFCDLAHNVVGHPAPVENINIDVPTMSAYRSLFFKTGETYVVWDTVNEIWYWGVIGLTVSDGMFGKEFNVGAFYLRNCEDRSFKPTMDNLISTKLTAADDSWGGHAGS